MFPCFNPFRLLPAVALGLATLAAGEARADLTQAEYEVPALDAQGEPIEDCNLLLTMQYDPEHEPAAGFKSLMYVHGGGWVEGMPLDKQRAPTSTLVTSQLTRRGFVVYSPEYRLIRANHAKVKPSQQACGHVSRQDQHRDIEQGFTLSVLLSHYQGVARVDADYGILMVGHSAGGHLATHAAMNMSADLQKWVRGVVSIEGPASFESYWRQERGLDADPLAARDVQLGEHTVTLAAVDPAERAVLLRTLDNYLAEGRPGTSRPFVELDADDPFIIANTFARRHDLRDAARAPVYFIAGANDNLVPADGLIASCRAIGPIHDVVRISRGFWLWHQTHYIGRCGGNDDRIHLVTPADHAMNLNQTFWRDALGWADTLDFSVEGS